MNSLDPASSPLLVHDATNRKFELRNSSNGIYAAPEVLAHRRQLPCALSAALLGELLSAAGAYRPYSLEPQHGTGVRIVIGTRAALGTARGSEHLRGRDAHRRGSDPLVD